MNDRVAPAVTATEASATQLENQKAQATRNAMVGPNSRSILAWIPSPPKRENWASAKAMQIAPIPLTPQLSTAFTPSGARLTGNMKMAPPMIVPMTRAVVIQMPISWDLPLLAIGSSPHGLGISAAPA